MYQTHTERKTSSSERKANDPAKHGSSGQPSYSVGHVFPSGWGAGGGRSVYDMAITLMAPIKYNRSVVDHAGQSYTMSTPQADRDWLELRTGAEPWPLVIYTLH